MASAADINIALAELAVSVARDPVLISKLQKSYITEEREQFIAGLCALLPENCQRAIKDPWCRFLTYCRYVLLVFLLLAI